MKNIVIAQSVLELKFLLNRISKIDNLYFLPLNLEVQLYCMEKKISYLNPIFYTNKKFHHQAIVASQNMIKKIQFDNSYRTSEKINVVSFLRFYFNSIIYLIEIINKIDSEENINKIYVSGWFNYKDTFSNENYYISFILKNLFRKKVVEVTQQNIRLPKSNYKIQYLIKTKKFDKNSKIIILSNIGYNFFRILKYLFKKKEKLLIFIPQDLKIPIFKKIIFKILRIQFFSLEKLRSSKKISFKLPKVQYKFGKYNISKLLNFRINQEKNNILKNKLQFNSFEKFFSDAKPFLVIANNSRGLDGLILDFAYKKNIPFLCIPHGTLSQYFNKFDCLYKKIISESITYPKSTFVAQSMISKNFFIQQKNNYKNMFLCGNILFAEKNIFKNKKNKKILYAVTMKDFNNIQYLGVEMFYEFLDNLTMLNNLALSHNLDILVKNHPTIYAYSKILKNLFKNLTFTNQKIQKVLNKTNLTISFSSSVIEDSLYNSNPVILFDRWRRYKHCVSEMNPKLKNKAVYYINNEKNLVKCINTVFKSKNINFKDYIVKGKSEISIKKLLSKY